MSSSRKQHLDALGLEAAASRQEVKAAFRRLALQLHPDLNPTADAQAKYQRIAQAAEALLGQGTAHDLRGQPVNQRRRSGFERLTSNPRFPLYFSAASLLLGCCIFVGAYHAHSGLYNTGVHNPSGTPVERTQEQQRMAELLQEHMARKQADMDLKSSR